MSGNDFSGSVIGSFSTNNSANFNGGAGGSLGGGGGGGRMPIERVSDEEFKLDISNFDSVIEKARSLADRMGELKNELDGMKSNLMFKWVGMGRNTFEKKYRLLSQQFGDLRDDLREISENLYLIEESYIQADTDLAKTLAGKDSRF